jgi:hypothetical protein
MFESVKTAFKSYVNSRKVVEELDLNIDNHKTTQSVLQALIAFEDTNKKSLEKSPKIQRLAEAYYRNVAVKDDPRSFVRDILAKHKRISVNLAYLSKYVCDNIRGDVVAGAVTVQQSTSIYLLCSLMFVNGYIVSLLSHMVDNQDLVELDSIEPPFTEDYVKKNMLAFATAIGYLSQKQSDFEAMLSQATDTVINDDTIGPLKHLFANSKLRELFTPFNNQNFHRIILNIRLFFADESIESYKLDKEKKQQLELRLLQLQLELDGKSDPSLEQQIKHTQNRIDKLQASIEKFERQVRD